jgi:voltage-gated potassium channel
VTDQDTDQPEGSGKPGVYDLFISLVSVITIALIIWHFAVDARSKTARIIVSVDLGICAVFFVDFIRNLICAPRKWRYLTSWGLLDLAATIPVVHFHQLAQWSRPILVIRGLKAIRALRGTMCRDRRSAVLVTSMSITMAGLAIACWAVLYFEGQDASANIKNPDDALWWAVVTMSTVGYGDFYPVTTGGRLCAVVLMVTGIGMFATLAGIIADLLRSFTTRVG